MVRVALLDRDGVLNKDRPDYIKNEAEFEVFPFARDAVEEFKRAGWLVYVVSNQSVVARGLASREDVDAVTEKMAREVGPIDGVFYCYHKPEDGCGCRKPEPGLLLQALARAAEVGTVEECWMVGDSARDVEAGRRAGCLTAVVLTGRLGEEEARCLEPPPDVVGADVREAAKSILALPRSPRKK
jgi:D-glycero-D-manno-heptose 1,7-bisphosphate phosphatase